MNINGNLVQITPTPTNTAGTVTTGVQQANIVVVSIFNKKKKKKDNKFEFTNINKSYFFLLSRLMVVCKWLPIMLFQEFLYQLQQNF